MISFTKPEHGWLGLIIDSDLFKHTYEISDVGPDSLREFRRAVNTLQSFKSKITVECNLEPSVLILTFTNEFPTLNMSISEDSVEICSLQFPLDKFLFQLSSELDRIEPLCINDNWTN